ncbi:hypothetical protein V1J52_24585 [Streptomyces sp. TRM 70351]|uniref:hypothetical protein n=1 Tax=Streptomyces sp. TRM 70351 TaxID=3116552 RepID=UPI002E7C38AB|nr:hypothetical protein [Streptomyces sp. TRM 70351]MEE1931307.1 hypothetical protein [Streptomyces sp. TRM 70351]
MMIDYNVSDHWSPNDPDWLKALVSSLDRRHGMSTVLPLTVIVNEVAEWVQLASGVDAWKPRPNRDSLRLDLEECIEAMGSSLRTQIGAPLAAFESAFSQLISSPRAILEQLPGTRTDAVWTEVSSCATDLLAALKTDAAVRASWDDLVATAQNRTLAEREYRPIAELLFVQLEGRGHHAEGIFRNLVSILAFGRDPDDVPIGEKDTPFDERLTNAREYVGTPARKEPTVVWLGYKGRIHQHFEAGRVCFYDAHWAVPCARPGRTEFAHKAELWKLVQHGYTFRVAELVDEESDVDTIVRVDLGTTTAAGAVERAIAIVDVILSVSIHRAGGIRPNLAQYEVLRSGQPAGGGHRAVWNETGFPNDTYGASITTEAIGQHGQRIAEALARQKLPRFLAAAIEVQMTADHPFSCDMALRKPSEADVSSVIPLSDRVVRHVAAHATINPNSLFSILGERWAHARWLTYLQRAAGMCLLGRSELLTELTREWLSKHPKQPWLLFLAERADDFLSVCRVEHERAWIARMFASISSHAVYCTLVEEYTAEGSVLDARRRRVRNALVHGNPTSFAVVQSVREYAEFVSGAALNLALESYVDGTPSAVALAERTDEFIAMKSGEDAETYWRKRIAKEGWSTRG